MATDRELAEEMGYTLPTGEDMLTHGDDAITTNALKAARSAYSRRSFRTGENLNTVTDPGLYWSNTYSVSNSLVNGPRMIGAVDRAVCTVSSNGTGETLQIWSALGAAGVQQPPIVSRRRDSAGTWSEWLSERWTQRELLSGEDMNSVLTPGMYWIRSYTVANSLVNGSRYKNTVGHAVVEVGTDKTGYYFQKWTTMNPVSVADNPIVFRRGDTTGAWSEWSRLDSTDAQPIAGLAGTALSQSQEGIMRIVAGLTADTGQPWRWTAPAGDQLVTPTHEGSGQTCHPSVLYFPDKWNGWEYWMCHTPYPWGNEAHEDPNIAVSHDGNTWQVPAGLTNPLDDQTGAPNPHNSDGHLVMLDDGRMMLTWRMVDRPNQDTNIFYQRISSDGVTWTPKAEIFRATPTTGFVSQALVRSGSTWRMYAIATGELIYYESSATIPGPADWGNRVTCNTTAWGNARRWWHVDVQFTAGKWWLIVNDVRRGSTADGNLYLGTSADGDTWDVSPVPIVPKLGANYDTMYKSGFVVSASASSIDIFYSAFRRDTVEWHVFRTTASKISPIPSPAV